MQNPTRHHRWRLAQWLELRWWQRYLRRKQPGHYLEQKQNYWQQLLDQLDWKPIPNAHVLDAGCGPAGIFIYLHDHQRVTALDPLLELYRKRLRILDTSRYPEVEFVTARLEEAAFDRRFDEIYCLNAINHVDNWAAALDNLTRLSRPGTRMLLSSDVHRHNWLLPIFRLLPGDALHPQQHNAEHYRNALTERGWVIEKETVLRREAIFEYRAWSCRYTDGSAR